MTSLRCTISGNRPGPGLLERCCNDEDGGLTFVDMPPRKSLAEAPCAGVVDVADTPLLTSASYLSDLDFEEDSSSSGDDDSSTDSDSHPHHRLYDREDHRQLLLDSYHKVKARQKLQQEQAEEPPPELLLINAKSGMGKTALANSIRGHILADGGFFVSGKFIHQSLEATAQHHQRQPFAPFAEALDELVRQMQRRPQTLRRVQKAVLDDKDFLAAEIHTLLDLVPLLQSVIVVPDQDNDSKTQGDSTGRRSQRDSGVRRSRRDSGTCSGLQNAQPTFTTKTPQFAVVFRRFLRLLLSCLESPLVVLLDDLHWADPMALDLLQSLLMPSPSSSQRQLALFIGTCRSNEVTFQDPLAEMLRRLEDKGARIVDIQPTKLGLPAISQMISDSTGLSIQESIPMALLVFQQTQGNPFFSVQYIKSMCRRFEAEEDYEERREGELDSSSGSDEEGTSKSRLSSTTISDQNIVRWLTRRMKVVPEKDAKYLVQVISCLGGHFNPSLLLQTTRLSKDVLQKALSICLDRNFIEFESERKGHGKFAHDKYQEAASALFSSHQERAHLCLQLGRNLQESCRSEEAVTKYQIHIVDLMLGGKDQLQNDEERENLAHWCLQVGSNIATNSSFTASCAIDYMEHGIALLSCRHWRDQYRLSLALYNGAAELAYCQGDHNRVQALVEEIKANARSFMDQLQACMTSILSLGAQRECDKAIAVGSHVLRQLGHPFPRKMSWFGIQRELYTTRKMLNKMDESDILSLKPMVDPKAMAAMTVIQMLHPVLASSYAQYTALTGSRLVRLTLKYGLSPMSAIGFSLYGLTLVRMGLYKEGQVYGELAEQQLHAYNCEDCEAKVCLTLGMGPAFTNRPFGEASRLMKRAHIKGLQTGDIETSMRATVLSVWMRFLTNEPLQEVNQALSQSGSMCDEYGSASSKALLMPCDTICTTLMGNKSEPLDRDHAIRLPLELPDDPFLLYALIGYFAVGMYMNKLDFADQLTTEFRKRKSMLRYATPIFSSYHTFCEAVVFASLGRTSKARRRLVKLRRLEASNSANFSNKVCLVQAQLEATAGRKERALSLFKEAAHLSEKHGFVGEQALALEKAGMMLLESGCRSEATSHLSTSRLLYEKWGAHAKVKQLGGIIDKQPKVDDGNLISTRLWPKLE